MRFAPSRSLRPRLRPARALAALAAALVLGGCIYRLDIQQGNVVDEKDLAQVDVGMTRSQVQFLLGTPMVADTFHEDRWDYPYYLKTGHHRRVQRRWFVVYFQNDRVVRVDRNLEAPTAAEPASGRRAKRSGSSSG
ncbi:MAG TPA: outer membrane protein assembly factor BamE [Gammaproteobacteria bacterium]|nr:outer membrane protein assembly factor BamE [Gammaproteobacteria bacterium]